MLDDNVLYAVHPQLAAEIGQQPEVEEQVIEQEVQEKPQQEVAPTIDESQGAPQKSFRELRERAERAERERDQIMKFAQENLPKQTQPAQQQKAQKRNLGKDDIVEGKDLDPIEQEVRELREELNQYRQQNNHYSAETRIKAQYPDFDRVCSKENLEMFSYRYPELAATLRSAQDPYAMGVSAYTLIKKFNIDQTHEVDMDRTQKNISKPKPTNAISPQKGDNPLSRAHAFAEGLTEDLKKQLVKEMDQYRKNY